MYTIPSVTLLVASTLLVIPGLLNAEMSDHSPGMVLAPEDPQPQSGDIQERALSGPLHPQSPNPVILSVAAAAIPAQQAQQAELDPRALVARIQLLEKVISCLVAWDGGKFAPLTSFPRYYGVQVFYEMDQCQ